MDNSLLLFAAELHPVLTVWSHGLTTKYPYSLGGQEGGCEAARPKETACVWWQQSHKRGES